jgi:DivIVA domain-containing protein
MALTPEDVVNKRFQPTKFREGYDQDEVDDFLDEVVVELRRLNQENEELRQRLIAGESRISELQRSASSQAPAPAAPAPVAEQPQFAAPPVVAAAPIVAAAAAPAAAYPAPTDSVDPSNTNNLLQLARKLHEEHVREGIEKRDALIAEGTATAARVVSEAETAQQAQAAEAEAAAQAKAAEIEAAAQAKAEETETAAKARIASLEQERDSLEQERTSLETRIDGLRTFEREYRQKLKSYIEGQLAELDSPSASGSSDVPASVPSGAPQTPAAPFSAVPAPQPAGGFQGFGGN